MTSRVTITTEIPGPRSRALWAREAPLLAPGSQRLWTLAGLAMERGEGAHLTDVDGNTYIDWVAGIGVCSIGHAHPRQVSALAEQAARVTVGSFPTEARARLLARIARLAPAGLDRVQLYSGGAEAVESALRLARAHTGHEEVLSFWGGFHGKTGGVLNLMGSDFKHGLGPMLPKTLLTPYPDCYRCPFATSPERCGLLCAQFAEDKLRCESTGDLAAVLVEPIQGTAGNVVPPAGFLPAMAELAHRHGALLVADEMITGFGRTGRAFGCEHFDVIPEIMTVGKGLGAGFPISALISTSEIVQARPWSEPSAASSSYGGNPLAAAAAAATLEIMEQDGLTDNARVVGQALLERLQALQLRHHVIGDVRGRGLMIGVDLVADPATRAPLDAGRCEALFAQCLRRGLITMSYTPRVRINPPLCIDRFTALQACDLFEEALETLGR